MLPKCEVNGCENPPDHILGVADVSFTVCRDHRDKARELARKCARRLFEARMTILEEFGNSIFNIGKEE